MNQILCQKKLLMYLKKLTKKFSLSYKDTQFTKLKK